jgi:hypothetical protein
MDEWIDILKDRLREAESPLPPGDWDVFEAKYKADRRRRRVLPFVISSVSIAAAAVVAALLFLSRPSDSAPATKPFEAIPSAPQRLAETIEPQPEPPVIQSPQTLVVKSPKTVPVILSPHPPVILSPKGEESQATEEVVETEDVPAANQQQAQSPQGEESNDFIDYETSGKPTRKRLTVAPHFGGMRSDVAAPVSFPSFPGKNVYASNHGKQGLDYLSLPYSNSLNNGLSSLSADHSIPITFGVDLSFPINQRLAITSGVEMSSYKSVFTEIIYKQSLTQNRYLTQNALYLGIPLRIDWSFWQGGKFSAWIGAGGKVDRCVYARLDGEDIRDKDFNFSALADAGIRYDFLEYLGIYLAPEVSWYFKPDNPSILTYRTEHPFALTINVGLRLNL